MIQISDLTMRLTTAGHEVTILEEIHLSISEGEFVAIVGPSGSGKSTLLGLIAGLDQPTSGTISVAGLSLTEQNEEALALWRQTKIGIIFQSFHLLPHLTARENVKLPLDLRKDRDAAKKADRILEEVGLTHRLDHYPIQLSGGEQQRIAIARATISEPVLLLADEPTGNLDTENATKIMNLLLELHHKKNNTLILITHNPSLAQSADRVIHLQNGRIDHDQTQSQKCDL